MTSAETENATQIKPVLATVFLAYLALMTLNPIIAPLSREVELAEWQVGVTISVAAVMVVVTSRLWGRRSQSVGRKRILIAAFALGLVAALGFALVAYRGMVGAVTGTALFVLFIALRGIGLGAAVAAIQPTAQAYIADITADEASRVKGMAGIGAVQGVAQIAGSVIGGLLAGLGLLVPIVAAPIFLLLGLLLVTIWLPREPRTTLIARPVSVRPTDPRIWPFLVAGFGIFTSLGFIQLISGFIVQDRLQLDAEAAGLLTGAAVFAAGIGIIGAQMIVVPKTGWPPATLLRVGGAVALLGFVILIPDAGPIALYTAMVVIGLGFGIAMPGYTAGPTLLVTREEQGGLAGTIAANMGLTFVIAPTAGTFLYGVWKPLPVIVGALIMAAVTVFVFVHPRFRRIPAVPGTTRN